MKRLADCLPAGLRPEPCALCRQGHPRFPGREGWVHELVTLSGRKVLGPCSNPPALEPKPASVSKPRTHEECVSRLHAIAERASAVSALGHETYVTHSQPPEREPGSDDD